MTDLPLVDRSLLVPAKLQKVVVDRSGRAVLEVFGGCRRWLTIDHGAIDVVEGRPARAEEANLDISLQGMLRKELLPGILSAVDIDTGKGLIWLRIASSGHGGRTIVVETDAREPRWFLLATTTEGARILGSSPAGRPSDERDTRRGRLYEPPRRAPALRGEGAAAATATPLTSAATVDPALTTLRARLKSEHDRLKRLQKRLEGDLGKHGDPEAFARDGELLKTVMGTLRRGPASVDVTDHEGVVHVIALDPARDASENLQAIFERARRARAARLHVAPRLADNAARLAKVMALREQVLTGPVADDVIAGAIAFLAGPEAGPSARRKAATAGTRQPWRTFVVGASVVRGGVLVRVGRSAKDNDALVKSARGNDVWMHARDRSGSHVIIPSSGAAIPDEVMIDAGHLAAWFSQCRGETHVDVQHTRVKHLKKPGAGAPAGLFLVANEAVMHLRVDESRLRRLLATEVAAVVMAPAAAKRGH